MAKRKETETTDRNEPDQVLRTMAGVEAQLLPARRPPTLAPAHNSIPSEWPSNFDLTTEEGKAGLINAGNPPVWRPQDGGTFEILATHFVVCPGEAIDEETGQVSEFTQTVFVDREGRNVKMSSDWAPRRLHAMLALYSPEQWARGIRIECYTGVSRKQGRNYASFRILPSASSPLP